MESAQNLSVTTDSLAAMEAINTFHHQVLSSGKYAGDILVAANNHPESVLIQVYAAIYNLFSQENDATQTAKRYLLQAEKNYKGANLREQLIYNTVKAWAQLDYQETITGFSAILALYPRDTLVLKLSEWIFYCLGQAYSGPRFLSLCNQIAAYNPNDPYFMASHSFALELTGDYPNAYEKAQQAMALEERSPWAHHTISHCYLMTNQIEKGAHFLESVSPIWEYVSPLLKGHNTWHLALFYLANRQDKKTIELYKKDILGLMPGTILEQIDAISLLWRMDMAGFPQNRLFNTLSDQLNQHPYEYHVGFNSVHFFYCLARTHAQKEVNLALAQMEAFIQTLPAEGEKKNKWEQLILPFCKGTTAFATHDYKLALQYLSPIITDCYQLGGSDAQDELFLQMYLFSLLACKKQKEATSFFKTHLIHYNNTALAEYWFSEV